MNKIMVVMALITMTSCASINRRNPAQAGTGDIGKIQTDQTPTSEQNGQTQKAPTGLLQTSFFSEIPIQAYSDDKKNKSEADKFCLLESAWTQVSASYETEKVPMEQIHLLYPNAVANGAFYSFGRTLVNYNPDAFGGSYDLPGEPRYTVLDQVTIKTRYKPKKVVRIFKNIVCGVKI